MSDDLPAMSRIIDRPSILNMRDLGGLRTRTGRLRRGLLFRAGSFAGTSVADASWLVRTTGLRTLVDLRTRREIDRDGRPDSLIALGVAWRQVPFGVDGYPAGQGDRSAPVDFVAEYRRLSADAARPLREILMAVGRGELPLVFACSMGKDRTGVIAALLLSALGVRRQDTVRDYALTARRMRSRTELIATLADRKGIPAREVAVRLETRPDTMRTVLETCPWQRAAVDPGLIEHAGLVLVESHQ